MTNNPLGNPNNTYTFGKARFTFLTDRFVRIEWDEEGLFTDEATFSAVNRYSPDVPVHKKVDGQTLRLKTGALELVYQDQEGPLTSDALAVTYTAGDQRGLWHFGEEDPENLGGTIRTLDGMKADKRNIRNAEKEVIGWVDNPPDNGLISRSGYAVIDDSENVCFKEHEGHFSQWPEARREGSVDLYFMAYGQEYKTALRDASKVFGKMPLPPRFALGYWYSRYFPFTDKDLREIINTTRTLKMPMDVMVIDMEWHKPGWTGYTWDQSYFPNPEKLLQWLHSQNIKTTLNLHPAAGVAAHEVAYPAFAEAMGMDPERKESIDFDITDPKFMEHYFKLLHHPLEKEGVDFWWMDWQQGQSCSIRNLDPLMMVNKLHYEDLEQSHPEQRPLIFSRYCGLGSGRYPIGFSGDTYISWESLAFQPGFTAGSANILYGYWSHDIGGHYRGELTPELFMRWIQYGVYSPILRVHSGQDRRLWEQESPYRWMMIEQVRKRYEMIPYIYSEMRRGHETALALCYPLYYDAPDVDKAYAVKDQYMFGEKMLVAPITAPVDPDTGLAEKTVWLPEGTWLDTANGKWVEGGTEYSAQYTLAQTPVFVRAGTILPGLKDAQHLDFSSYENLMITCYPGGEGTYCLYEDDGSSMAYEQGEKVTVDLSQHEDGSDRLIHIAACEGAYAGYTSRKHITFALPLTPYPTAVFVNGRAVDLPDTVSYEGTTLTTLVSVSALDFGQQNSIRIEFPVHSQELFDGRPGELTKLLTLKEEIRGLGRGGRVYIDVDEDRFYFELVGMIERLTYSPETVMQELEAFDAEKKRALRLIKKFTDRAQEVLDFTQQEKDPEVVRGQFETLCFGRTVEGVIHWSEKVLETLPKLQKMLIGDF